MSVHDIYPSSRFSEPCGHVQDRKVDYCLCSLQHQQQRQSYRKKEETHFLDSIPFHKIRKSRCIPLGNGVAQQSDIFVEEMELKTQQMAQLVNKSISSESNDFVSPKFSTSSSYSTANDSSDDYFLSATFDDEIEELDNSSSRAHYFDRDLVPTINGSGRNIIDSKSHSASEDDDEVMFYFEP